MTLTLLPPPAHIHARLADAQTLPARRQLEWFQWLSQLHRTLLAVPSAPTTQPPAQLQDPQTATGAQLDWPQIESALMQWLTGPSPLGAGESNTPAAVRRLLADCLSLVYEVGEARSLYSNVNTICGRLPTVSSQMKRDPAAAVDSLISTVLACGVLLGQHGRKIASLVDPTVGTLYRIYKLHPQSAVRVECLRAMSRCFVHVYKLPEATVKDMCKTMTRLDSTFSTGGQVHGTAFAQWVRTILCCPCATQFHKHLLPTVELVFKSVMRAMDSVSGASRTTLCYVVISLLECMRACPAVVTKRLAKLHSGVASEAVDSSNTIVVSLGHNAGQSVSDAMLPFTLLSAYLLKYQSRGCVLGLMETAHLLLRNRGTVWAQDNYGALFKLFCDLATNPKFDSPTNSESRLLVQRLCAHLVKEVLGKALLTETARLDAVRTIVGCVIEPLVNLISNATANSADKPQSRRRLQLSRRLCDIAVFAMDEVSNLAVDLGRAAFPLHQQMQLVFQLATTCATRRLPVFLSGGWCMRALALAMPHLLPRYLHLMLRRLETAVLEVSTGGSGESHYFEQLVGEVYLLAQLLSAVPHRRINVGADTIAAVFSVATQMLQLSQRYTESINNSSNSGNHGNVGSFWSRAAYLGHGGWVLVGSMAALGPDIVAVHLQPLLARWRACLAVKPAAVADGSGNNNKSQNYYCYWVHAVLMREAALGALHSFIVNNTALCGADVARRLVPAVMATVNTLSVLPQWLLRLTGDLAVAFEPPAAVHRGATAAAADYLATSAANIIAAQSTAATAVISGGSAPPLADSSAGNSARLGPIEASVAGMCVYPQLATHVSLFKKRTLQVCQSLFTHCRHSPLIYEPVHVPLLRLCLDLISGDVMAGPTTSDVARLVALYGEQQSGAASGSVVVATSYLHGLYPDLDCAVDGGMPTSKQQPPRRSSYTLPTSLQFTMATPSAVKLKRQEGLHPVDCLDDGAAMLSGAGWLHGAPENDPWLLFTLVPHWNNSSFNSSGNASAQRGDGESSVLYYCPRPLAPATALTDCAIDLFGVLFSLQGPMYQEILLDQMSKCLTLHHSSVATLTANVGAGVSVVEARERAVRRGMAMYTNSLMAILSVCTWVTHSTPSGRQVAGTPKSDQTTMQLHVDGRIVPLVQELCMAGFGSANAGIRFLAAETLSKIVSTATPTVDAAATAPQQSQSAATGSKYAQDIIKQLVEVAVGASRDPLRRAGACVGLASVVKSVGQMATPASLLRSLVSILQQLAVDGNACVHSWALYAYYTVVEAVGVNMVVMLGAKEVVSTITATLLQVVGGGSSHTHQPFWGAHGQALAQSCSGQNAVEVHPALIDPFRSALRLLSATLGAFGPELQSGGTSMVLLVDFALGFIQSVRSHVDELYAPILAPVVETVLDTDTASIVVRHRLGFIGQSYAGGGSGISSSTAMLTSQSPFHVTMTECVRCFQQLCTFGAINSAETAKPMFEWALALTPTAPGLGTPLCLYRAVLKLVWHAVVAQWAAIGGVDGFLAVANEQVVVAQLFYLLDACQLRECVENGGGQGGGSLDDDGAQMFVASNDAATKSALLESELKQVLGALIKRDVAQQPNKWLSHLQSVLNGRTVVQAVTGAEPIVAIAASSSQSAANSSNSPAAGGGQDDPQDNDDGASDDGNAGGNDNENDPDMEADNDLGGDDDAQETMDEKAADESPRIGATASTVQPKDDTIHIQPKVNNATASHLWQFLRQSVAQTPLPTWRLQCFLLALICETIRAAAAEAKTDANCAHFNLLRARAVLAKFKSTVNDDSQADSMADPRLPLVLKLNDLIRLAFNAGTGSLTEPVRLGGLDLLSVLVGEFGPVRDPDFPEFSLLEQYQAQIVAGICLTVNVAGGEAGGNNNINVALLPGVQVAGVNMCAEFISSGVSSDLSCVARLVKHLTAMLDLFDGSGTADSCDCPFVWASVRVATLQAWALLFLQSTVAKLDSVLTDDRLRSLARHWLATLKELSRLRVISSSNYTGANLVMSVDNGSVKALLATGMVETMYIDASKAILVPIYDGASQLLMRALSRAVEQLSEAQLSLALNQPPSDGGPLMPIFSILLADACDKILSACDNKIAINNSDSDQSAANALDLLLALFHPHFVALLGNQAPLLDGDTMGELCVTMENAVWYELRLAPAVPTIQPRIIAVVGRLLRTAPLWIGDDTAQKLGDLLKLTMAIVATGQAALERGAAFPNGAVELLAEIVTVLPSHTATSLPALLQAAFSTLATAGCDTQTAAKVLAAVKLALDAVNKNVGNDDVAVWQIVWSAFQFTCTHGSLLLDPIATTAVTNVKLLLLSQAIMLTVCPRAFTACPEEQRAEVAHMFVDCFAKSVSSGVVECWSASLNSVKTLWLTAIQSPLQSLIVQGCCRSMLKTLTDLHCNQATAVDIIKLFTAVLNNVQLEQRTGLMMLLVPIVVQRLDGSAASMELCAQLVQWTTSYTDSMKLVLVTLDGASDVGRSVKSRLEQSVRSFMTRPKESAVANNNDVGGWDAFGGGQQQQQAVAPVKAAIALKMDFAAF